MHPRDDLAQFLRTRRARLLPDDVGLAASAKRRRVPGLRREELAQLAGVSAAYYMRLEQGREANVSDTVLVALGRALRFTAAEQAHLVHLARNGAGMAGQYPPASDRVRPSLQLLIDSLGVPASLLSRSTDVLHWNREGHALTGSHLPFESIDAPGTRPNMTRLIFLDPAIRRLFPYWDVMAYRAVSALWVVAGQSPEDPQVAALVLSLREESPEFAALWEAHPVRENFYAVVALDHPMVGRMELAVETIRLVEDHGQLLVLYSAEPGSRSDGALQRLVALARSSSTATGNTDAHRGVVDARDALKVF